MALRPLALRPLLSHNSGSSASASPGPGHLCCDSPSCHLCWSAARVSKVGGFIDGGVSIVVLQNTPSMKPLGRKTNIPKIKFMFGSVFLALNPHEQKNERSTIAMLMCSCSRAISDRHHDVIVYMSAVDDRHIHTRCILAAAIYLEFPFLCLPSHCARWKFNAKTAK